jgi:alkanesulfonate monooxygenase SsuD/methylene tetrahydromethanopterin reductase-like flavin-dependent oxidoreductase (luciferase family)
VKLGLGLEPAPGDGPLDSLSSRARQAEGAGIEIGWLQADGDSLNALLTASALAADTTYLRLAAVVRAGGHPMAIAEAAAVVDNASNGRLILVLQDAGDEDLLDETAEVLVAAVAPRPFRHEGRRWQIPANLPENDLPEKRILITPTFTQTPVPLWLSGQGAAGVARRRGLGWVVAGADGPVAARGWTETEAALGVAAARLPRVATFELGADATGAFDADAVVDALLRARAAWGLDAAILRPPTELGDLAFGRLVDRVATHVRPRTLLDELPDGLAAHWKEVLAP